MFELSLSPAISPSISPILAVTTAGTGDFAQALADATGDASALLRPALAGPLPSERQIPAAAALPIAIDVSEGAAPVPVIDPAPPIILPRPPHVANSDPAPSPVAKTVTITVGRPAAPKTVSRLPIVSTASAIPIDVAPPSFAKIARQPRLLADRPVLPASQARATADTATPVPAVLPVGQPVDMPVDQPDPIDRADAFGGVIEVIALPPVFPVAVTPTVPVQAGNAPAPGAPAATQTTVAAPSDRTATSPAIPTVLASTPAVIQTAIVTPSLQSATSGASPTIQATAPALTELLSSADTDLAPIGNSPVSAPTASAASVITVSTAAITSAPAAPKGRLAIEAAVIPPVEAAIPLPVDVSLRPAAIDLPRVPTLLPTAVVARSVDRDLSKPADTAGAERQLVLPRGVVINLPTSGASPVTLDPIQRTPVQPPSVVARTDSVSSVPAAPFPPPLIGVPVPALRAFAAAIAATSAPAARSLRDDEALIPSPTASAPPEATIRNADSHPRPLPPIDMQREDWTRALIDRIDAVRDVANARDSRITLVPDSLGKIEVALRQQGETLHVSFAADAPATRALLADAEPRLAELAEARGLKLGDTAVSARTDQQGDRTAGGFGQPTDQRRPAPAPQGTASNRSNTINPAHDRADSDNRIA